MLRTLATLERHGIILEHRGRQLTLEDFDRFDYILAMDRQNLREIEKRRPKGSRATVALFGDFRQDLRFDRVIADPYYGQDASGFNTAFEQCKDFAAGLIDSIRGKE
ncbi:Low molecular weight phosphotyrosine protein phosphatase [Savitreella phatthalungensis]